MGALTGAISGLAGPEAGLATRAAIDAAASAGGQVLNNALNHKPLGDGVLAAAAIGGASSLGLGLVAKAGGAALAKLAGRAGEDVEAAASHEVSGAACGLSFAAGTLVATPSGERPIASLKVGDTVLAVDPKTGKASMQTVQQVFLNHDTDLLNVTLHTTTTSAQRTTAPAVDPAYKQRMAAVASHGSQAPPTATPTAPSKTDASASASTAAQPSDETIHTIANHPWLSADRGWVVAGKLQLGEQVLRADGSTAEVVALTTVYVSAPMWDLTVSQVHDFAVGNGAYVVHNCGKVEYGSTDLSKSVKAQRIAQRDVGGNYAAARLDDGTTIIGRSHGEVHAEQDILAGLKPKARIVELFSEREPCANRCGPLLNSHNPHMKISWSWDWNGQDHAAVTRAMKGFFRKLW